MIKIVVKTGPHQGQAFLPPPDTSIDVGRDPECFVCVLDNNVSRRHSSLVPDGSGHRIRDAGSRNGTYVNEVRITGEKALRPGDTIRVGGTVLLYLEDAQDPWIGKTVAGYRIVEKLGSGGMGTVYRALQVTLERPVALKILSSTLGQNGEFVERFIEEARAMAKASHPHVVQVHNVGQDGEAFYLSMEYLEGGSLKAILDRDGPMAPRRALRCILDAARALVWAAERGIVHRDIKPANLFLDADGRVKVGDFGLAADLAKRVGSGDEGRVLGSPPYMAPEQALGKAVDQRADIYALGATLYTLLAGRTPFEGKTVKEVLVAKLKGQMTPLSQMIPWLPRELEALVETMMAREPSDRVASAAELLPRVARLAEAMERSNPSGSPKLPPAAPEREEAASPWRWILPGAAVLVLAIGFIAALWVGLGSGPPPSDEPGTIGEETSSGPGTSAKTTVPASDPTRPLLAAVVEPGKAPAPKEPPLAKEGRTASAPPPPFPIATPTKAPRALPDAIVEAIEVLLFEARFAEARVQLDRLAKGDPSVAKAAGSALAGVNASERLFHARAEALDLSARGESGEARRKLLEVAETLEGEAREEALEAANREAAKMKGEGSKAPKASEAGPPAGAGAVPVDSEGPRPPTTDRASGT